MRSFHLASTRGSTARRRKQTNTVPCATRLRTRASDDASYSLPPRACAAGNDAQHAGPRPLVTVANPLPTTPFSKPAQAGNAQAVPSADMTIALPRWRGSFLLVTTSRLATRPMQAARIRCPLHRKAPERRENDCESGDPTSNSIIEFTCIPYSVPEPGRRILVHATGGRLNRISNRSSMHGINRTRAAHVALRNSA